MNIENFKSLIIILSPYKNYLMIILKINTITYKFIIINSINQFFKLLYKPFFIFPAILHENRKKCRN